jgi:hypothetical protein
MIKPTTFDLYSVFFLKIPFTRLNELIRIIPYCEISFSNDFGCLLGRLTTDLVKWIQSELGWNINLIRSIRIPTDISSQWFNKDSLSWEVPKLLNI